MKNPSGSCRRAFVAFLIVVSAIGAAAVGAQTPTRVRAVLPAYREPIALDTIMLVSDQDAPAGKVWAAAEKVFYDLKIPTDTRDSAKGVIGVVRYTRSGMMDGKAMSQVLSCGISITGPNADNFRINMVLIAIVTAVSPTTSKLGVAYVGSGLDMRGSSTNPVMCNTTGRLEIDFAERVKKRLLASP